MNTPWYMCTAWSKCSEESWYLPKADSLIRSCTWRHSLNASLVHTLTWVGGSSRTFVLPKLPFRYRHYILYMFTQRNSVGNVHLHWYKYIRYEYARTWLLFSDWLLLFESGKWMWQAVCCITCLMLLPPRPITWLWSVYDTSIFNVTRVLCEQSSRDVHVIAVETLTQA